MVSRRLMTLVAVLALAIGVLTPLSASAANQTVDLARGPDTVAESATGSYVVVMAADPLVAEFDRADLRSRAAQDRARSLRQDQERALEAAGASKSDMVNSYTNAVNGFSAIISYDEAKSLAALDEVAMVLPDELRQPTTDSSPGFLGLTAPGGAWATGINGDGVIVGVIDTGIWPEHPSFADDGSYRDLHITLDESERSACDFGNTAHNPNDAPFECNDKLLGARQMLDTYRSLIGAEDYEYDSARDDDGHGTHTASTAAGNSGVEAEIFGISRGTVSGIAPRARVIMYKGLGELGGFSSDLAAAIDQAVADGVDVINYSIGSSSYAIGADDVAFLFAADAGVFVATSAGNNGPGAATTGSPASSPWVTAVGASTQARTWQGSAVLGDGSEYFGATITSGTGSLTLIDAADAGSELCFDGDLDPAMVAGKIVLCLRGVTARVDKSLAVYNAGGAGMILYNPTDTQALVTDNHWVPSVHINNTDGLAVKDYIDAAGDAATATINGGVYTPAQGSVMADFSSRGPNLLSSDVIRPDLTAPGVNILAGNSPTPYLGAPGELFQSISGTSMSSPHVAGLFALIKQKYPLWTPAMARSALMTTARQDVVKEDGVTPADPFDMGAGHVDPGRPFERGSSFQPGLVYNAGLFEYAAYTCGEDLGLFSQASCDYLESLGIPMDASDLNLPSIAVGELAGSQTITRTVISVARESAPRSYQVSVDAPDGYDVTVSPSRFVIRRGQSMTYQVTITANGSAPVGEWRHGSLTWHGTGGYDVYSPISVRGVALAAPDEVQGTGTDGSASFDVSFGYTGDYSAAPHGLVPATITSGDISQDPDQTYPSPDDGVGVDKIDFTLADVAFARWRLVVPGDDDIDLFLEDSSGNIVAQSTNGGTDELIELVLPANDTYTMVVHGWSVPNQPLPYDLESWLVPIAGGGSLSVDSAPSAAVVGDIGTIDVSWSGLSTGTNYLGAVSHSDGSGIVGLTLVSVDTN